MFNFIKSLIRKIKIYRLQKILNKNDNDFSEFKKEIVDKNKSSKYENTFESYLDLCEKSDEIKYVMVKFKLKREDLKEVVSKLNVSGAGGWVCGNYVSLSSIAYAEPLIFYLISQRDKLYSDLEISFILNKSFGELPGKLFEKLESKCGKKIKDIIG